MAAMLLCLFWFFVFVFGLWRISMFGYIAAWLNCIDVWWSGWLTMKIFWYFDSTRFVCVCVWQRWSMYNTRCFDMMRRGQSEDACVYGNLLDGMVFCFLFLILFRRKPCRRCCRRADVGERDVDEPLFINELLTPIFSNMKLARFRCVCLRAHFVSIFGDYGDDDDFNSFW